MSLRCQRWSAKCNENGCCVVQVMFVEVTGMMLRKGISTAKTAKKYDLWQSWQVLILLPPALSFTCLLPI